MTTTTEKTYWNGKPATARRVVVIVADAEFPAYWAREFVGQERSAVEISEADCPGPFPFYLDDHDGSGWSKVTLGMGSPRYGHRDLAIERVVRERFG